MALYRHLTPKYINDYGDKAGYMAVAVMNELFLGKPSNPEAGEFLVSNRNRVKSEFLNLKYDENVCLIVSQAIHIYARLAWINGEKEASIIKLHEAVKRLEDAGIYIPGFEQIEPTKFYLSALHFLGETEED